MLGPGTPKNHRVGDGGQGTGMWQVPCPLPVWDKAGSGFISSTPEGPGQALGQQASQPPRWLWGQDERWRGGQKDLLSQAIFLPGREQQEETELGRTVSRACPSLPNSENPGLPARRETRSQSCVAGAYAARASRGEACGHAGGLRVPSEPRTGCLLAPATWALPLPSTGHEHGVLVNVPNTAIAPQPTRGDEAGAEARQGTSPLLPLLQRWPLDRELGKHTVPASH